MLKLGTVILSCLSILAIAQPSTATLAATNTAAKSAADNLHAQIIINFPNSQPGWRRVERIRERERWEAIRRQRQWERQVRNRYPDGYGNRYPDRYNGAYRDDRYKRW